MKIFTIGFTKTGAESFFSRLQAARVRKLIDVRLHNVSQLAGFAKAEDLRYFLRTICSIDYEHRLELAPTQELFDAYKQRSAAWPAYEQGFLELLADRRIEKSVLRAAIDGACLLCSEDKPHHCHRRLVAEYLERNWGEVEIVHL